MECLVLISASVHRGQKSAALLMSVVFCGIACAMPPHLSSMKQIIDVLCSQLKRQKYVRLLLVAFVSVYKEN